MAIMQYDKKTKDNIPLLGKRPLIIGLTGGIACGKTAIASLFAKLGVPLVDADVIAREVVMPGSPLLLQLKEAFGGEIIKADGSLKRSLLREIVFDSNNPKQIENLNAIMQPAIKSRLKEAVLSYKVPYVIAVIPLLFEQNLTHLVDRVLVVDVKPELQLQRLMFRDGIDEKLARAMIANQVSRDIRIKNADDLVESDDSPLDQKYDVVVKLHANYLELAKKLNSF